MIRISTKLAVLTHRYPLEGHEDIFHPARSHLELCIYELIKQSGGLLEDKLYSVLSLRRMQVRGSQLLAEKTFEDSRCIIDIVDELVERYNGLSDYYGVSGICEAAAFTLTIKNRILREFFNV